MAGFQDPVVGGISLRKAAIRSPNYVPGSIGWTINIDGSAEFSNVTIRGTITASTFQGTNFVINSSGAFFYSGTPAAGNLIASIAPASGTDSFGNTYLTGITSYGIGTQTFSEMAGGSLLTGNMSSNVPDTTDAGFIQSQGPLTILRSVVNASPSLVRDALRMTMSAGQTAQTTGSASAPNLGIIADDLASAADLYLSGSAIKTDNTSAPYTWQLPSYGTNWSGSTTFNGTTGVEPLRFRLDAEDNLWPIGGFKAGAVVPADPVFILPAGYIPIAGTDYIPCLRNNGGAVTSGMLRISNNGHVDVLNSANLGIAANNEFLCNGKVPLRHIS